MGKNDGKTWKRSKSAKKKYSNIYKELKSLCPCGSQKNATDCCVDGIGREY